LRKEPTEPGKTSQFFVPLLHNPLIPHAFPHTSVTDF
jgi:hypothetical protein